MPFNVNGYILSSGMTQTFGYKNIITRGLVFHLNAGTPESYPGSGNSWYDLTSGGYHGTLTNGPTYNTANGGSIVFDGSNDYVTTADVDHGTLEFTLEAWVYFNSFNSNNCIIKKNTDNDYWPALSLYVDNTGVIRGYYSSQSYGACLEGAYTSTGIVTTGQWVHLAYSKGPNGYTEMKIYKNGVSQSFSFYLYGSHINQVCNSGKPVLVGIDFDTPNFLSPVNGKIPIVRIYNRQLTSDEMLYNYNVEKTRFGL
jgi:hypothetical protein